MSTRDLINAIAAGEAIEIENAFNLTMAEKISSRIEEKRIEVAQNMFAVQEEVENELDEELDENLEELDEVSAKLAGRALSKMAAQQGTMYGAQTNRTGLAGDQVDRMHDRIHKKFGTKVGTKITNKAYKDSEELDENLEELDEVAQNMFAVQEETISESEEDHAGKFASEVVKKHPHMTVIKDPDRKDTHYIQHKEDDEGESLGGIKITHKNGKIHASHEGNEMNDSPTKKSGSSEDMHKHVSNTIKTHFAKNYFNE